MIDIHCHMLPMTDDGAQDAHIACEMATHAYKSGVKTVLLTPHCGISNSIGNFRGRQYDIRLGMFRALLKQRGIPLQVLPGCELFGSTPYLHRLLEQKRVVTLNHSRYLLVEFNFHASGREISDALQLISRYGLIPVVAHPERYRAIQNAPQLAADWFRRGYILQVNKGSLLGRLGTEAEDSALHLLDLGLIHVIASDAHDMRYRPTGFLSLLPFLEKNCPQEYIDLMLEVNPQRIISNQSIPLP